MRSLRFLAAGADAIEQWGADWAELGDLRGPHVLLGLPGDADLTAAWPIPATSLNWECRCCRRPPGEGLS